MSKIFKVFKIQSIILLILPILFFTSCGYKASSTYAKKELGEKIYVSLSINVSDPKNSVIIKDVFNELLIQRLDKKLVYKKDEADTIIYIKNNGVSISTLSYDSSGYSNLYKITANLNVKYSKSNGKTKSFIASGSYDFSSDSQGTISDTKRFNAIQNAFDNALEEVISQLAIANYK